MEGRKQVGSSSSSSFTTDLFGSKESSPAAGIFASIFSPSSKVLRRESMRPDVSTKKQDSGSGIWNTEPGSTDNINQHIEGESQSMPNRGAGSIYQEQSVQPCHLSSSIYYGGQDVYSFPQHTQNSGVQSVLKDSGEDDSGSASRGNWWQGSLYY